MTRTEINNEKKAYQTHGPDVPIYSDIVTFIRILVVNSWLIVLLAVVGALAAYVLVEQQTPIYETHTSVIVSPRVDLDISSTLHGIDVLDQNVVGTYVQILRSRVVAENAYDSLEGTYPRDALEAAEIDVRPIENSTVTVVTVRSDNPDLARDLANEVAIQTIQLNPVESLVQAYPIKMLDEAVTPDEPVSPQKQLSVLLGAAAGAAVGVGLAFLLDSFIRARRVQRMP